MPVEAFEFPKAIRWETGHDPTGKKAVSFVVKK